MDQYKKYVYLVNNYYLSKSSRISTQKTPTISQPQLQAGHFKVTELHPEHGLILTTVSGQKPILRVYVHGKRLRRTIVLQNNFSRINIWQFINKFVNIILPSMEDFHITYGNDNRAFFSLSFKYYFEWDETSNFMSERVIKKNIFMPLILSGVINTHSGSASVITYLRMLRFPLKS